VRDRTVDRNIDDWFATFARSRDERSIKSTDPPLTCSRTSSTPLGGLALGCGLGGNVML
jgi:hypothetical protein